MLFNSVPHFFINTENSTTEEKEIADAITENNDIEDNNDIDDIDTSDIDF